MSNEETRQDLEILNKVFQAFESLGLDTKKCSQEIKNVVEFVKSVGAFQSLDAAKFDIFVKAVIAYVNWWTVNRKSAEQVNALMQDKLIKKEFPWNSSYSYWD